MLPGLRMLSVFSLHFLEEKGCVSAVQSIAQAALSSEEEGQEDDDTDDEEIDNDDDAMDIASDHGETEPVAGPSSEPVHIMPAAIPQDPEHGLGNLPVWLLPYYSHYAVCAENFIDDFLRKPNFQELRFLQDVRLSPPRDCRIVRFGQAVDVNREGDNHEADEKTGGRVSYMARYLGVLDGKAEDDAFFWLPSEVRRATM